MPTQNQELAPPWRLMQRWMPFWRSLSAEQRSDYLQRWEPPDEDWREYVTEHWV